MKNISFIKKIALPYLLVIAILLSVVAVSSTQYFEGFIFDGWKNELMTEAKMAASQVSNLDSLVDKTQVTQWVVSLAEITGDRVTLILPDGTVIGESQKDPGSMENHLSRPEIQSALAGQTTSVIRISTTLHSRLLYSAAPVIENGKIIAVIRLAKPVALIDATMSRYKIFITFITLGGIVICLILMFFQSSNKVNPLYRISEKIRSLSLGNLTRIEEKINRDEIGTIISSFNTMVDKISGQVDSLQEERLMTNAILENMKDGVILVDETGHVTLINPAAEELFKIQSDTSLGNSLAEVVRDYQVLDLWKQCVQKQAPQNSLLQIALNQESIKVSATLFHENLPGDVLLLFQDLTLVRKLQTIRQDFVSNVSHELRTPLSSLKLLTETLMNNAIKDPQAANHFLEQMNIEIDNMTQIVQELLDLSKIESGRVPLDREPVSPYLLVEPAIERMRLQADRTGIKITNAITKDLPTVSADIKRVQQVIVNLLHNAIKFTNPGGSITLAAQDENDVIVFSIQDNGAGISEEDLGRIFERFYKTDRARASGGTGLGLSIARHIIEGHGGKIWAESRLGEGSTFFFSIPKTG